MVEFSWYLLEACLVLSLMYGLYALLLRRETFFNFNRFFLLATIAVALIFPSLSWDWQSEEPVIRQPLEQVRAVRLGYFEAMDQWYLQSQNTAGSTLHEAPREQSFWNWKQTLWTGLLSIYIIGVLVVWSRLGWMLYALYGLARRFPSEQINGIRVVKLPDRTAPFSFLRTFFVNQQMVGTHEFQQILAHEQVHIRQRNSIDLIIVQILAAGLWFHPLVWRLLKSLKTTHEYIADKQILSSGHSLVAYQSLLLSQLISNQSYGLVHNFNLSFIKKRITMMKIKQSGWGGRAKVAITLSLLVVIGISLMQCNSHIEESSEIVEVPLDAASSDFTQGVNVPVIQTAFRSNYLEKENALNLNISIFSDQVVVNGKKMPIEDIQFLVLKNDFLPNQIVTLRVDTNQSMSLVRLVQTELRRLNLRKILYVGQSQIGEIIESAMLLPPLPGAPAEHGPQLPVIDDAYIAEHDMHVLKIKLGQEPSGSLQQEVYNFVKGEAEQNRSNYVVSADFEDSDIYQNYLNNLVAIQDGFNQIYEERSQVMFGGSFMSLDKSIPEEKEQYDMVRKGIPRAISIAEKGC